MGDRGYYSGLTEILLFIVGGFLFVTAALITSRILRPNRPNSEKLSTYESGEEPQGDTSVRLNIRFYIIALIFILFEAEVVFLFPWSTVFVNKELMEQTNGSWGWFAFMEMALFIVILALGLLYAWANGHLDWIRSRSETKDYSSPVPKELYDKINERYAK